MVHSKAQTVSEYLKELPPERRKPIEAVRKVIRKNLPKGYQETMNWGMISYEVPLKTYPETYNGQPLSYAALASQKNHMAVYLMNIYADKTINQWFIDEYKDCGKKLNMGKSCIRFKKLEDLPLTLIGKVIARTSVKKFIAMYEAARKK